MSPRSARPPAEMLASADPITPELALVSPELAEAARSQLSDHPRETGVRPTGDARRDPRHRATQPALGRAGRSEPVRSRVLAVDSPSATVAVSDARASPRRSLGRKAVGIASVAGALVAAWFLSVALGHSKPAEQPAPLLPNGGYVVSPSGSFMTDKTGERIETFTLPLGCGSRPLVVRDIPMSGRSFEFTGKAVGRAITVRVHGRVLDRTRVEGTAAGEGRGCTTDLVAFVAYLS